VNQDTQKKTYEKVAVLGVKREAGYLYFLRGSDVYRTALNGPQNHGLPTPSTKTGAEKVAEGNFTRDPNYLYFIDESGDVSRVPRLASRPPEFVVGFLFDSDLKLVVLIRKRRPKWMNGRYNGVGGHVEEVDAEKAEAADTTPELQAMIREWREETGDDQEIGWKPFMKLETRGGVIHFFAGTGDVSRARTVTDEKVNWWEAANMPSNVLPNLRWLVPMAQNHLRESDSCDYFQIQETSYRSELDRS
jgi:8-oxo-dGTP diphosphatase